jgi:hypothetical protein
VLGLVPLKANTIIKEKMSEPICLGLRFFRNEQAITERLLGFVPLEANKIFKEQMSEPLCLVLRFF